MRFGSLHRFATLIVGLTLLGTASAQTATPARSDPKAVAIADKVMQALGGPAAWDATRYLRFDFAVEREGKQVTSRAHTWDKHSGRYRLEAKTREGQPYIVLMNVNSKEGSAWLDGKPLEGDELKKYLDQAYATWINDTYWLLMPYKLKDPGVILGYDGEETAVDGSWDKLVLTFDNVGLTPKDKYWVFVNKTNHLVERWDYILKGGPGPATSWLWKGWQRYGAIMLAPERINTKDNSRIHFPVLDAPTHVEDSVFTSAAATKSASGAGH